MLSKIKPLFFAPICLLIFIVSAPMAYALDDISLHLTDAPISSVLTTLAKLGKRKVLLSHDISGMMSLNVDHVGFDQALEIVLKTEHLGQWQIAGVTYIAPLDELAKMAAHDNADFNRTTRYFILHYANAKDILTMLNTKSNHFLSPEGEAYFDARTSTLIVTDHPETLAALADILAHLDVPVEEIKITARIVIMNTSSVNAFGVMLGTSSPSAAAQLGAVNNLNLNLGIDNPAGVFGFGLGKIAGNNLDLALQALESEGNGKIISAPELIVSDNEQADIEQGSEIPFQTATSSGATQIEFKKAVLGLKVTPHLAGDNKIVLNLQISKDAVSTQTSPVTSTPIISTSAINTRVMMNDGETIVLGGIYNDDKEHNAEKVPFLNHLPFLGWLFQNHTDSDNSTDLVVFVTPKVIHLVNLTSNVKPALPEEM